MVTLDPEQCLLNLYMPENVSKDTGRARLHATVNSL